MCALSPPVQHFIAAVLNAVLQKLVHLQEQPWETRPEPPIDCARRAIWGMLYADDACIVAIAASTREKYGDYRTRMRRIWPNYLREEDGDHVLAGAAHATGRNER